MSDVLDNTPVVFAAVCTTTPNVVDTKLVAVAAVPVILESKNAIVFLLLSAMSKYNSVFANSKEPATGVVNNTPDVNLIGAIKLVPETKVKLDNPPIVVAVPPNEIEVLPIVKLVPTHDLKPAVLDESTYPLVPGLPKAAS